MPSTEEYFECSISAGITRKQLEWIIQSVYIHSSS